MTDANTPPKCTDCDSANVVVVDMAYDEFFCQRCADKYGPSDWDDPRRL